MLQPSEPHWPGQNHFEWVEEEEVRKVSSDLLCDGWQDGMGPLGCEGIGGSGMGSLQVSFKNRTEIMTFPDT